MRKKALVSDVQLYWQQHPLFSYELSRPGSSEFFNALNSIKLEDTDRYATKYWGFKGFTGKRLLEIGCGPGWLAVQYALAGAKVSAVDITKKAVELTKKHLEIKNVSASLYQANAENLPFKDEEFDVVISSGVLHHTPDTPKAFKEASRVLRRGGQARISLYRKGILHNPFIFGITLKVMKLLRIKHPGADMARNAESVDEFIRMYDGADNPVGIAFKNAEWKKKLEAAGFKVNAIENHLFPRRFLPFRVPDSAHEILDKKLGTMAYFRLSKPYD